MPLAKPGWTSANPGPDREKTSSVVLQSDYTTKLPLQTHILRTSTTYPPSAPCIIIPPLERCPTLSCSLVEPHLTFPVTSERRMTRSYLTATVPRCFLPSRSAVMELDWIGVDSSSNPLHPASKLFDSRSSTELHYIYILYLEKLGISIVL